MKRLVIYFHYDRQGVIDTPCRLAVQAMLAHGHVFFVTNGTLSEKDRAWVRQSGATLLERENAGFDVGAYRQALLAVGREKAADYDEIVLMNYTLAGPVADLQNMFAVMEARQELDFWGLTRHYTMRSRRFGGRVPEHLQSHFLAVRSSVVRSEAFWHYWESMRMPESYEDSVIRHETRFTPYFASLGYVWDSYVDTRDLGLLFVNPIMACPRVLVAERGCPFFKRRSFFTPYRDELRRTDGSAGRELYEYLRFSTEYPVEELLRALLRDYPLSALMQNLQWYYPATSCMPVQTPWESLGLRLLRWTPIPVEPVTDWYLAQSAARAEEEIQRAVALFAKEPLLGVLSPSLPLWPELQRAVRRKWRDDCGWVGKQLRVPVDREPPPAPHAGWALVRLAAFPQGIPEFCTDRDVWLLPLLAQKSGYISGEFVTDIRFAAGETRCGIYMNAAEEPVTLAKQMGRLIKRKLKCQ